MIYKDVFSLSSTVNATIIHILYFFTLYYIYLWIQTENMHIIAEVLAFKLTDLFSFFLHIPAVEVSIFLFLL